MSDNFGMAEVAQAVPPVPPVPGWIDSAQADFSQKVIEGAKFDGSAQVYEWDEEFGEVGPKVPDLEKELFGDPDKKHGRTGLDFSRIDSIEVQQEGPVQISPIRTFDDAGLHPVILENIKLAEYTNPTPIQKYAIPALMQGHDIIGVAQTGSGKTAAYLTPILSRLMGKAKKLSAPRPNPSTFREGVDEVTAEPLVMVVVPTRELAVQIFNEARKLCYRSMLRPGVVYGGVPVRDQAFILNRGCDILIGTPGRLIDFISRPRCLSLRRLKYMVIDEADEMLEWEEDLQQIIRGGDQDEGSVNYALFSATFPRQARDLAEAHLNSSHVKLRVGRAGSTTENIKQIIIKAERHEKRDKVVKLLEEISGVRTIIFCNSRQEVDYLDDFLYNMKLPVTSMHSDRSQEEREAALRSFRSGFAPILIATGVTARGIDVDGVMHVINYDLPSMDHGGIEEYTHRIGRTGRIGHRGLATSFFSDRDEGLARILTKTLLETKQEVPSFLELYSGGLNDGQEVRFDSDSDGGFGDGENVSQGQGANSESNGNGYETATEPSGWESKEEPSSWNQPSEQPNEKPHDAWGPAATTVSVGDAW